VYVDFWMFERRLGYARRWCSARVHCDMFCMVCGVGPGLGYA